MGTADDNPDQIPNAEKTQADQAAPTQKPPPETDHDITDGDLDRIRADVPAQVDQEKGAHPQSPADNPSEVSAEEIKRAIPKGEYGLSEILCILNRYFLVYNHDTGVWYFWNGTNWEKDPGGVAAGQYKTMLYSMLRFLNTVSRDLNECISKGEKDPEKQSFEKRLRKFVKSATTHRVKKAVLAISTEGANSLSVTESRLNQDPFLLCCRNGVVDQKTGELLPGRRKDYLTLSTGIEYRGVSYRHALWEDNFLMEVCQGDIVLIEWLSRIFGYFSTGDTSLELFLVLLGLAAAGKSRFIDTVMMALGSYAYELPRGQFLKQGIKNSSSAPSEDRMALRYKRLVLASETNSDDRIDEGPVKAFVSGQTITGRHTHGREMLSFKPCGHLVIDTNYPPGASALDSGIERRMLVVPFDSKFCQNPKAKNEFLIDPEMKQKLLHPDVLSGVLSWLVRGCLKWQYGNEGLDPPESVRRATLAYRNDIDFIGQFLDAHYYVDPENTNAFTLVSDMNARLVEFSGLMGGRHAPTAKSLNKYLLTRYRIASVKKSIGWVKPGIWPKD